MRTDQDSTDPHDSLTRYTVVFHPCAAWPYIEAEQMLLGRLFNKTLYSEKKQLSKMAVFIKRNSQYE